MMPPVPRPWQERLAEKVARDGDCIVYVGGGTLEEPKGRNGGGYGKLWADGKRIYVHRLVLEEKLGRPIAPGMMALHHCDNPPCCNPAHIYEDDHKQNMADKVERGRATNQHKDKTHCHRGHEFNEENTHWKLTGGRQCRICQRKHRREWARKRETA